MKSRTIAIAGSIAALTLAAAPVTAFAATNSHHRPANEMRLDRSRDASGVRHVDRSPDKSKDRVDDSRDRDATGVRHVDRSPDKGKDRVDDSRDLRDR